MGEKKVARISRASRKAVSKVGLAKESKESKDDAAATGKRPKRTVTATMLAQRGLPLPGSVPHVQQTMQSRFSTLPIDSRAAYLVAQMDGKTTLQEIIDLSPLSREATIAILLELYTQGIIVFL